LHTCDFEDSRERRGPRLSIGLMARDAADDMEERGSEGDGNGATLNMEGAEAGTPRVRDKEEKDDVIGEEGGGGGKEEEQGDGGPPVRAPGSFRALLNGIKAQQTPKTPRTSVGSESFISLDLDGDAGLSSKTAGMTTGKRGREDGGEGDGGGKRLSVPGDDFMSLDEIDNVGPGSLSAKKTAEPADSSSISQSSTPYNKKSPWARGRSYQISSGDRTVSLHHEICDFIEFIQPVCATRRH